MLRALRHIGRLTTVARTLARHGALAPFAQQIEGAGLAPAILLVARLFTHRNGSAVWPGVALARALIDLGPVFIKLGQLLSTRSDILGEEVAGDLARLQDRLPPFPGDEARAIVAAELGQPIEALFESFDVTFRNLPIPGKPKEQCDIDIDPFARQLLYGR